MYTTRIKNKIDVVINISIVSTIYIDNPKF